MFDIRRRVCSQGMIEENTSSKEHFPIFMDITFDLEHLSEQVRSFCQFQCSLSLTDEEE